MKDQVHSLRNAAERWSQNFPVRQRCRTVATVRHEIAASLDELVAATHSSLRSDDTETVAAELIPLCDALQYLGRRGGHILQARNVGIAGRPLWMWGVRSRVERVPHGVVLVIGTWNYPLLLAGVQVAQALAAGNGVLWKPAPGAEAASRRLADCFFAAGIPRDILQLTGSDVATAQAAIDAPVDHIVLTGSAATGRRILQQAAQHLTPTTLELSGCDAAIALPSVDLDRFLRAVRFGLCTNSGATCIGPRRLIVAEAVADRVTGQLAASLADEPAYAVHPAARGPLIAAVTQALEQGGVDLLGHWAPAALEATGTMRPLILDRVDTDFAVANSDLFAPVASLIRVAGISEAIDVANRSPYGLAASVFGDRLEADEVAKRLHVGSVTVNDLVAPTADPRLPFGGRGNSGYGVTRGPEGLLAMTRPRTVSIRRSRVAPHLLTRRPGDQATLSGLLQIQHATGVRARWAGLRRLVAGIRTTR